MGCVKDSGLTSLSRTIIFFEQMRSSIINPNIAILCGGQDEEFCASFMCLYLQQNDCFLLSTVFYLALSCPNFKLLTEMKK